MRATKPTGRRRADAPRYRRTITAPIPILPPLVAEEAPATPRRSLRAVAAMLAVTGLTAVSGLPAFASSETDAPPSVAPLDGDVQHFVAPGDAGPGSIDVDQLAAQLPVTVTGWDVPVHGRLGDPFGPRPDLPVAGVNAFHRGQDLVIPCGTPVRAAADGVVVQALYWGTYGNWIMIDVGGGVQVGYAHEQSIGVSVGQRVQEGQVLGISGSTGASTGCHVHVEVHVNGVAVNPVGVFEAKDAPLGR